MLGKQRCQVTIRSTPFLRVPVWKNEMLVHQLCLSHLARPRSLTLSPAVFSLCTSCLEAPLERMTRHECQVAAPMFQHDPKQRSAASPKTLHPELHMRQPEPYHRPLRLTRLSSEVWGLWAELWVLQISKLPSVGVIRALISQLFLQLRSRVQLG